MISATGRYVIFDSLASDLVRHDTNDVADIFVRDRQAHTTIRVSVGSGGAQGDMRSFEVGGISDDGRYALYDSEADNLVPNDTDLEDDVFVRDRQRHTTTRVSVSSTGAPGDAGEYTPSISGDGRWVAFASFTSLAPGDTNLASDVYLHDMQTGQTTLESVNSAGTPATAAPSSPRSARTAAGSCSHQPRPTFHHSTTAHTKTITSAAHCDSSVPSARRPPEKPPIRPRSRRETWRISAS